MLAQPDGVENLTARFPEWFAKGGRSPPMLKEEVVGDLLRVIAELSKDRLARSPIHPATPVRRRAKRSERLVLLLRNTSDPSFTK